MEVFRSQLCSPNYCGVGSGINASASTRTLAESDIRSSLSNIEKMLNTIYTAESITHDKSTVYTDNDLEILRVKPTGGSSEK